MSSSNIRKSYTAEELPDIETLMNQNKARKSYAAEDLPPIEALQKAVSDTEPVSAVSKSSDIKEAQPQAEKPENYEEPGYIESALRGVAQGATLGFADEMTAALESLLPGHTYKKAVEESRQRYKEAEEAHGAVSTLGEIVGSFAPIGLISKGIGAGAGLVRGAGELAESAGLTQKIADLAAMGAKGEGGLKALATAGALEGGVYGGLTGAGTAESMEDVPKAIEEEAKFGATLGAAGGAAFGGLKKLGGFLADTNIGKEWKRQFELQEVMPTGPSFGSASEREAFEAERPERALQIPRLANRLWTSLTEAKNKIFDSISESISLNKTAIEEIEKRMPARVLDDAQNNLVKQAEGSLDKLLDTQNNLYSKIEAHPAKEVVQTLVDNADVTKALSDYHTANEAYKASVKPTKVIADSAKNIIDELKQIRYNMVNEAVVEGKAPIKIIPTEVLENSATGLAEKIKNNPISSNINLHNFVNKLDITAKDLDKRLLNSEEVKKLMLEGTDYLTIKKWVLDFHGDKQTLAGVKDTIKKITNKPHFRTVLDEINSTISMLQNSMTKEIEQPSLAATSKLDAAIENLNNVIDMSGIDLFKGEQGIKNLNLVKRDRNIPRLIAQIQSNKGEVIRQQKYLSSLRKGGTLDRKAFATAEDISSAEKLADAFSEIKDKYKGFQNLTPEMAKNLYKDIKGMETYITGSSDKFLYQERFSKPETYTLYKKFKDEFEKAVEKTSAGKELVSIRRKENLIGTMNNYLTGSRHPAEWKSEKGLGEWPDKIYTAFKEKTQIGNKSKIARVEKIAQLLGDAEIIKAVEDMHLMTELGKKYEVGKHWHGFFNPLSEFSATATASAIASSTKGIRKDAAKLAEKLPNPNNIYSPKFIAEVEARYPTVGRMMKRLEDTSLAESKRRAYQNILMNNPVVRKLLSERGAE